MGVGGDLLLDGGPSMRSFSVGKETGFKGREDIGSKILVLASDAAGCTAREDDFTIGDCGRFNKAGDTAADGGSMICIGTRRRSLVNEESNEACTGEIGGT